MMFVTLVAMLFVILAAMLFITLFAFIYFLILFGSSGATLFTTLVLTLLYQSMSSLSSFGSESRLRNLATSSGLLHKELTSWACEEQ